MGVQATNGMSATPVLFFLAFCLLLQLASCGGCLKPCGSPCACCGIPSNGHYYLTSFDGTTCSCGACHQYGPYFAADRQRYGCGTNLHVCRNGKCVKVRVTDYGPSCFVENDAGGPVLDASPAVCRALTGGGSCGWSDHFSITVSRTMDDRPYGPFNVTREEYREIIRQGKILEDLAQMTNIGTDLCGQFISILSINRF